MFWRWLSTEEIQKRAVIVHRIAMVLRLHKRVSLSRNLSNIGILQQKSDAPHVADAGAAV